MVLSEMIAAGQRNVPFIPLSLPPSTAQTGNERNFTKLVEQFKKSLHHTDYMVMEDLCTSMSFIDIYLTTLDHQDSTLNR